MQLLFIDPQGIRHAVTPLARSGIPGFWTCRTSAGVVMSLHYSQLLVTPELLDALLAAPGDAVAIRHKTPVLVPVPTDHMMPPVSLEQWVTFSTPPPFRTEIECKDEHSGTAYSQIVHNAIEVDSLRQRGYTHWRRA